MTEQIKPGMVRMMRDGKDVWEYPPIDPVVSEITDQIAKELSVRVEQYLSARIKPKPRFISQRLWLRLVSFFIYVERTQPTLRIEGDE